MIRRHRIIRGLILFLFTAICLFIKRNALDDDHSQKHVEGDSLKQRVAVERWTSSDNNLRMRLDDSNTVIKHDCPLKLETQLSSCSNLSYASFEPLPKASIIISFHNSESLSALLHTVHSLIQRSPSSLIEEIIIIDDFSKKEEFGGILENYIRMIFPDKVKLYRNSENLGLIRSRLKGARISRGEVLFFMDSHSEVQIGWLEPLLFEIKKNRKCLVSSVIDSMERKEDERWEYKYGCSNSTTIFDWSMGFGWSLRPREENPEKASDAYKARTIIGAYIAIEKRFFQEIGEFDDGMEFWGGENIDLALRVWLFGGEVLTVPCSRVAHLEGRGTRAYRTPYTQTVERNYKRLAEVWFDDYKECFYYFFPQLLDVNMGNITDRLQVKAAALHDMKWYLQSVFPELGCPVKDGLALGPIRNKKTDTCLTGCHLFTLVMTQCSDSDRNQIVLYWSADQHLREPNYIYFTEGKRTIKASYTSDGKENRIANSKWIHWKDGPIIDIRSKLCLEAPSDYPNGRAILMPCNFDVNSAQIWSFRNYTERYDALVSNKALPVNMDVKEFLNTQ